MENCKTINTPMEYGSKLSKHDEAEPVDPTLFKSLVGCLRYLTCTRPDILFSVGVVCRYMEAPTSTHFKAAKRILRYIKSTTSFGLLYSYYNNFKLIGYSDSDWAGDQDNRKSTSGFVLCIGNTHLHGCQRSNRFWRYLHVKRSTWLLHHVFSMQFGFETY